MALYRTTVSPREPMAFYLLVLLAAFPASQSQQFPNPQCPCYLLPSGECLSYDSRYQATDVEEAIVSFPDLSLRFPPNPVDVQNSNKGQDNCVTEECRECQSGIRHRITMVGIANVSASWTVPSPRACSNSCHRYSFCQYPTNFGTNPYVKVKVAAWDNDNSQSAEESGLYETRQMSYSYYEPTVGDPQYYYRHENENTNSQQYQWMNYPYSDSNGNNHGSSYSYNRGSGNRKRSIVDKKQGIANLNFRAKRQQEVLGTRYNISCTPKGINSDVFGSTSLCSSCWAWRQLPLGYFPQFVNELICDDRDLFCLSGYASCRPGYRNLDVLRNVSGVVTALTITSGAYCECRCNQNSPAYGLVMGSGTSNALPPQ